MRTARPEPSGFAAKAKDLQALRDAVDQAATVSGALWLSYIGVFLYLAIAAGAVTHKDLFFENPVKLPFLGVELPLIAFFALGPALFLIVHWYTLVHFALLAGKVGAFQTELEAQNHYPETRARLRRQLPSNIFVQFLAGPRDLRGGLLGWMLRGIAWISLIVGPVLLLVLFQLQFLPYHDEVISWWQRIAVVIDLILIWTLWPFVERSEYMRRHWWKFLRGTWSQWRNFYRGSCLQWAEFLRGTWSQWRNFARLGRRAGPFQYFIRNVGIHCRDLSGRAAPRAYSGRRVRMDPAQAPGRRRSRSNFAAAGASARTASWCRELMCVKTQI